MSMGGFAQAKWSPCTCPCPLVTKGQNITFVLMSTQPCKQAEWSPCNMVIQVQSFFRFTVTALDPTMEFGEFTVYLRNKFLCLNYLQGDHSACAKPPVDFTTKVPLWPSLPWPARPKRNFCFEVNGRFCTSWMVTLYSYAFRPICEYIAQSMVL